MKSLVKTLAVSIALATAFGHDGTAVEPHGMGLPGLTRVSLETATAAAGGGDATRESLVRGTEQLPAARVRTVAATQLLRKNLRQTAATLGPGKVRSATIATGVVPEPGDWAAALVGLLGVGVIVRRRMSS